MNYLFWNVNKNKNINYILVKIIKEYQCDVVALAEYECDSRQLIEALVENEIYLYEIPKFACERITILTKYTPNKIESLSDGSQYTLKLVPHESLGEMVIVFVHLSSKLHTNQYDQSMKLHKLIETVEKAEEKCRTNNTIIVGDFNVNPFEQGMISASGCHAVPCRMIASRLKRVIGGEEYKMFYNPMWNLFGDIEYPPGTYYYNKSIEELYYWNIFDQVIIRPSIVEHFDFDRLKILTSVDGVNLLSEKGKPKVSDHLPIIFKIS